jgi:hypothetical protein
MRMGTYPYSNEDIHSSIDTGETERVDVIS